MNVKQQVSGLNDFLTTVYGTETRLSTLLASLGFDGAQIEIVRSRFLAQTIAGFLGSLRERMARAPDGERLYQIASRRFGLDGEPPDTLETLGQKLGLSLERVQQMHHDAIKECQSAASRQFFRKSLHGIVFAWIESAMEPPSQGAIVAKLDRLAELQASAEATKTRCEARRAAILAKVQSELDLLDAEYGPLLKSSAEYSDNLVAEIKNDVRRHGANIRSGAVQAVYAKGRVLWDAKGLGEYSETHPDIARYRRQGQPTVIVRFLQDQP